MLLKDGSGRKIDYLRISITDRCNLRCRYCMPPDGVDFKPHDTILRYEEISKIVRTGVKLGIRRVRITGGEPLARMGVPEFVAMLAGIKGLKEISMTSNAVLLAGQAPLLKKAGLDRVNISLDSLKRDKYQQITSRDQLDMVIKGIDSALEAGLNPVKINVVVTRGVNDDEIMDFVEFARVKPVHVRFIEYMPLGSSAGNHAHYYLSLTDIREKISKKVRLTPVIVRGNGPASYFTFPRARGTIGFITPISHGFCGGCNRLRLTADGKLRPCLASEKELNLLDRSGSLKKPGEMEKLFLQAAAVKPGSHHFNSKGEYSGTAAGYHAQHQGDNYYPRNMSEIGG